MTEGGRSPTEESGEWFLQTLRGACRHPRGVR